MPHGKQRASFFLCVAAFIFFHVVYNLFEKKKRPFWSVSLRHRHVRRVHSLHSHSHQNYETLSNQSYDLLQVMLLSWLCPFLPTANKSFQLGVILLTFTITNCWYFSWFNAADPKSIRSPVDVNFTGEPIVYSIDHRPKTQMPSFDTAELPCPAYLRHIPRLTGIKQHFGRIIMQTQTQKAKSASHEWFTVIVKLQDCAYVFVFTIACFNSHSFS